MKGFGNAPEQSVIKIGEDISNKWEESLQEPPFNPLDPPLEVVAAIS